MDGQIGNVLNTRQNVKNTNISDKQTMNVAFQAYKAALKNLENLANDATTLGAMVSEGKLVNSSAYLKYCIWFGLAICTLMIAIRQLKK